MRNVVKTGLAVALGVAVVGSALLATPERAEARPWFLSAFAKKYEKLEEQVKTTKCAVCHEGKDKKDRNIYGKALFEALGKEEKIKDKKKIDEAFEKAAKKDSAIKDKTFGDLIKEGKLPASKEEK